MPKNSSFRRLDILMVIGSTILGPFTQYILDTTILNSLFDERHYSSKKRKEKKQGKKKDLNTKIKESFTSYTQFDIDEGALGWCCPRRNSKAKIEKANTAIVAEFDL